MKNLFTEMKKLMLLVAGMIFIVPACTNLDEELYSDLAAENFFTTEEENIAAELNLKLSKIQRKLWINPFKFQQPEDLNQFNTKMVLTYLKPKTIIVTPAGRTHLEKLCQQVIEQGEYVETVLNEQNEKIEHSKTDAALLIKNKKSLALRWLHVSLQQLLYRDRHLFQTLTEKAA